MPQYQRGAQQLETKPAWAGLGWAGLGWAVASHQTTFLARAGVPGSSVQCVQSWVTQPGACHQCDLHQCVDTALASGHHTAIHPLIIVIMDLSAFYLDAVWIRFHN